MDAPETSRKAKKHEVDIQHAIRSHNPQEKKKHSRELDGEQKRALLAQASRNKDGQLDWKEFIRKTERRPPQDDTVMEKMQFRAANLVIPVHHRQHVYNYLKQYSCIPPPIFMLCITIAQVAVFVYYALTTNVAPGWLYGCPGCVVNGTIGPLIYHPQLKHQIWRYITYMMIHAGLEHLLGNMIIQLILGIPLELVHKLWRVGPLYLAGILLGSLLQSVVDPKVALVGASGGCYALLTAHLANVILNWREMPYRWIRLLIIGVFVGADVSFVIYRRYYVGEHDRVSYMAHIGGAVTGLLLGLIILRNFLVLKWEKAVSIVCFVLFIVLATILIVLNIVVKSGYKAT